MPPVLDIAIGLVFIYLLFSLVVTALNEIWLSWLDKRADFLQEGLRELLQDHDATLGLVQKICDHGLVNALSRRKESHPSYIGTAPFTAAVLDLIKAADPQTVRTIADFRSGIATIANERLRQSLTAILDAAAGDLEKFKAGLDAWFDRTMDRVSGWYKRYAQQWLFALSLTLAVVCNVDSIHIIQALSTDPKLLATTVDQAIAYSNAHSTVKDGAAPAALDAAVTADFKRSLDNLNAASVPIGWGSRQWNYLFHDPGHGSTPDQAGWNWAHLFSTLAGWLVTALAASLGAPFWFDTLNRFVNIRGNGRSPAEVKAEAAKSGGGAGASPSPSDQPQTP